ncbi:MAG: type II toxin-antitoxin system HipA family toxin [Chthoniobacterales bacterium]|nr:type II toxin-antitoxin system HipA family toxin [Chthoniobacterales bacterium]
MILEVRYQDTVRVGRLADDPSSGLIYFEYDKEWLKRGWELSPFYLPLAAGTSLQAHHDLSFQGLHGLFWDSLPDAWGRAVLESRLRTQGLDLEHLSPLLQLSYLGNRGMGALSYFPDADSEQQKILQAVSLASIDREASYLLEGKPIEGGAEETLALFEAGCSAGGAKPKVLASLQKDLLRIGPYITPGWEGWIIKLSNVPTGHKDSKQEGRMEYACSLMAQAANIQVPPSRLFEIDSQKRKKRRGLFATQRFDRDNTKKIHFHSLAGLLQKDFSTCKISYEDLASTTLKLTGDFSQLEEVLRRLIFNVAIGNYDNHAKNHGFLMTASGEWKLAPAFDLTLSAGMNKMNMHAMSVNGTNKPQRKDLKIFAENFGRTSLDKILEEVIASIQRWPEWAEQAGCRAGNIQKGKSRLNASLASLLSY